MPTPITDEAMMRLTQIIGKKNEQGEYIIPPIIPVSKSDWYRGVKEGRYPKPSAHLSPRCVMWSARDIYDLARKMKEGEQVRKAG